jgi:PAS domain S-box-containing protein
MSRPTSRMRPAIDLGREARRFLELAQDMVCIAGLDLYFKYLNSVWEQTLGFSIPELLSRPFIDFVHPEDRERTVREAQALGEGAKTINFENRYVTRRGDYRVLEWTALADLERGLIYASARDVTDARQTSRALNDFAHVVSHDLKAPLRGIGQLAEFLAADYGPLLDDAGREMLDLLQQRTRKMNDLIDGILRHSRTGRTVEEPECIDLKALLAEVVDLLAPPPHIRIEPQGELPSVFAARTHLLQLFQNLIANAVKFMDKPAGLVRLSCVPSGDSWHFCVTDNGPGIEARDFERIFEMFQTLGGGSGGTGVGLAIVRKIVELYGGRVWVESTVGSGSQFHFTLPRTSPVGWQDCPRPRSAS